MEPLQRGDVERFRCLIATSLGLRVEDDRLDWLADILRQRVQQRGSASAAEYLASMEVERGGREEWRVLAGQLTVVETYFFRSPEHFRALVNGVLPERIALLKGRRPLRMLSAGCASGEEPYSLAITVREHFPHLRPEDVTITAFDINSKMLAQALSARYTDWSLRDVPQELLRKYFQLNGKHYTLRRDIRSMVRLEERNLAAPGETIWEIEQYDVIFCRNVVMYLTAEAARVAIERLRHALCPGGFLFLSSAETLRGVSHG
ncbi:MAG TPA: protein-glutamate O-methyltransferase CheR, partial [Candidatus Acidoferrales bacterium]